MSKPYKTVYISDDEFWQQVKDKANRPDIKRSVSQIICKLLELWLDGKVVPYPENEEGEIA